MLVDSRTLGSEYKETHPHNPRTIKNKKIANLVKRQSNLLIFLASITLLFFPLASDQKAETIAFSTFLFRCITYFNNYINFLIWSNLIVSFNKKLYFLVSYSLLIINTMSKLLFKVIL
ncbi:hypothetical protein J6W34_04185 [bacterium]|nr:hypothetical protein [bacterium]